VYVVYIILCKFTKHRMTYFIVINIDITVTSYIACLVYCICIHAYFVGLNAKNYKVIY
jgi:hypothetical protein